MAHLLVARPVRPRAPRATAEMNMTPMIDVLLVLLVIFMAALPLSQRALDVNLPPETREATAAPPDSQIVLEYTTARVLTVNRQSVDPADLESRLKEIYATRRDKTMYLMGDRALRYGEVVRLIDTARGAGVDRVGIITAAMRAQ